MDTSSFSLPTEVIVHIFRYLRLYDSESARRVCRLWNQIGIESRNPYEIMAFPPDPELLHLGVHVRDPRYLEFVVNKEQLDVLLPYHEHYCYISSKVVTSDMVNQILEHNDGCQHCFTRVFGLKHPLVWMLTLPYEIIQWCKPRRILGISLVRNIINEIVRQSRNPKFDVRKIIYIMRTMCIIDDPYFPELYMPRRISDAFNSPLMILAMRCPEMAIYYKLHTFVTLEPRDEHLAKAILPREIYELLYYPNPAHTDNVAFYRYCLLVRGKELFL